MPILLVGLNHHTAPVELREQSALAGPMLSTALAELPVHPSIFTGDPIYDDLPYAPPVLSEGAILSTCNRLELVAVARDAAVGRAVLESFLSRLQGVPPAALKPHLFFLRDHAAVDHLARVACGLDSLILGEPQILGQVASALAVARSAGAAGPVISHLFAAAVRAGKRARAETDISRHTTSVSHAAARLAEARLGGLSNAHALILGAGEMAGLAAQALRLRGVARITCLNRTYHRAEALAAEVGGEAAPWHDLSALLARADVVITATGAPHTVLHADDLAPALASRGARPLVIVDIAVPRDVDAEVAALPGVICHNVDDLRAVLDDHIAQREAAIPQVEAIVEEESAAFARWMSGLEIVPTIADLRAWAGRIAESEVEHALEGMKDAGPAEQKAVELLAHRLVNKLLHAPTITLREQAERGQGYTYAHIARDLFDLGETQYQPNHAHKDGRWQLADGRWLMVDSG